MNNNNNGPKQSRPKSKKTVNAGDQPAGNADPKQQQPKPRTRNQIMQETYKELEQLRQKYDESPEANAAELNRVLAPYVANINRTSNELKNLSKRIKDLENQFSKDFKATSYRQLVQPSMATDVARVAWMIMNPQESTPQRLGVNPRRCSLVKDISLPRTSIELFQGKSIIIASPSSSQDKLFISEPTDFDVTWPAAVDETLVTNTSLVSRESSNLFQGALYRAFNSVNHYLSFDPELQYFPIRVTPTDYAVPGLIDFKFDHVQIPANETWDLIIKSSTGGVISDTVVQLGNGGNNYPVNYAGLTGWNDATTIIVGFYIRRLVANNGLTQEVTTLPMQINGTKAVFRFPGGLSHYVGADLPNLKLVRASQTATLSRVTAFSTLLTNDSASLYNGGLAETKVVEAPIWYPQQSFQTYISSGDGIFTSSGQLKKGRYNYTPPTDRMVAWREGKEVTNPWYGTDWNTIYLLDYSFVFNNDNPPSRLQLHIVMSAVIEVAGSNAIIATDAVVEDPDMKKVIALMKKNYKCYENPSHLKELANSIGGILNDVMGYGKKLLTSPVTQEIASGLLKYGPDVLDTISSVVPLVKPLAIGAHMAANTIEYLTE